MKQYRQYASRPSLRIDLPAFYATVHYTQRVIDVLNFRCHFAARLSLNCSVRQETS